MYYSISIQSAPAFCAADVVPLPRWEQGELALDSVAPRLIKTHNRMGYITTFADPFVKAFVQRASVAVGPVLELAAGYGLPSIAAAEAGCKDITISDIDPSHLDYARSLPQHGAAIQTLELALPGHGRLPDAHYELIFLSRVLHFFDGPAVTETLDNIFRWLKPGGEAYVVCDSIYEAQFGAFRQQYDQRVRDGVKWPGYFDGMSQVHGERAADLPDCFHYFDAATLSSALTTTGFEVEIVSLIARPEYPIEKKLDGREAIGAIARKSLHARAS